RLESPLRFNQTDVFPGEVLERLKSAQSVPALRAEMMTAVELMKSTKNARKVILIVSDGTRQDDLDTQAQMSAIVAGAGAKIYALSMTEPELYLTRVRFAEDSGRRHFSVAAASELPDVIAKIHAELQNTYLIGFVPANTAKNTPYDAPSRFRAAYHS